MPSVKSHKSAFALIITLITLTVSLATFASLSQLSLTENWKSRAQETEFQHKWFVHSAQRVLLSKSQDALAISYPPAGRQASTWEAEILMSTGTKVYLKIEDEQSKINLSSRFMRFGNSDAFALTKRLIEQSQDPLVLNWTPSLPSLQTALTSSKKLSPHLRLPPFCGWGQIYSTRPTRTAGNEKPFPGITSLITFWGDGKVNFKSAPDQVLIEALSPIVPQDKIGAIIDIRTRFPGMTLDSIMDEAGLSGHARSMTAESLIDRSKAFTLWIKIEDAKSVRTTCWSREEFGKSQVLITRTDW